MKKFLVLAVLLSVASSALGAKYANVCDSCDCAVTSKSFFSMRPKYQLNSPERLTFFRGRDEARVDGRGGAMEFAVFGGKSTSSDKLARYFLPGCNTSLRIVESDLIENEVVEPEDVGIVADHLGIKTVDGTYDSTICIRPQHSYVGVGWTYRQRFCENDEGRAWWVQFSAPVVRVRNDLRFNENIDNDGGGVDPNYEPFGAVATAQDAFTQTNLCPDSDDKLWTCGKIALCGKKKTGLADIEIALGREVVKGETCMLESYAGVIIPTGNKPKAEYLFEPIVGNNKHAGVFFGSSMGFEVWHHETEDKNLMVYWDIDGKYLFNRTEKRMFDLHCKEWSRYMTVYECKEQAQEAYDLCTSTDITEVRQGFFTYTPGANVFCQDLKVKPRYQRTINVALVYNSCAFQGELGYNFFCREAECVELDCPWKSSAALRSLFQQDTVTTSGVGCGRTDSVQNICNFYGDLNSVDFDDYDLNIIKVSDLNLQSAAHPGMTTHTIYGALGRSWDDRDYPIIMGVGGSYQFATSNLGMNKWMLWGKLGFSF